MVKKIDVENPFLLISNHSYLAVVEPGGYYEFRDSFTVVNGFTLPAGFHVKTEQRSCQPCEPIAKYSALRVRYHLSTKKHHPKDDFFRSLQSKWKGYGVLPLDSDDNYAVVSDLYLLQYPDLTFSNQF